MTSQTISLAGHVGRLWGLTGVAVLLAQAVVRLSRHAVDGLRMELSPLHWLALGAWLLVMIYFEGIKGFQRGFSPRVVARAFHLARHPRLLDVLLAPAFCMGLLRTTRRRLITSWSLLLTMAGLIAGMRLVPQPARGIVDTGVVAGLTWGLAALLVYTARAFAGRPPASDAEVA